MRNPVAQALLPALFAFALFSPAFGADKISGGNGTLYLGGRPNKIFILDEATEKVTGEIECKTGTPTSLTLSEDRTWQYIDPANVEFPSTGGF